MAVGQHGGVHVAIGSERGNPTIGVLIEGRAGSPGSSICLADPGAGKMEDIDERMFSIPIDGTGEIDSEAALRGKCGGHGGEKQIEQEQTEETEKSFLQCVHTQELKEAYHISEAPLRRFKKSRKSRGRRSFDS